MKMDYNTLSLEKIDHNVLRLILNRPDNSNAMNEELLVEFGVAIHEISNNDTVKVLIITGAGKNFCAGGDLGMVQKFHEQEFPVLRAFSKNFIEHSLDYKIWKNWLLLLLMALCCRRTRVTTWPLPACDLADCLCAITRFCVGVSLPILAAMPMITPHHLAAP